jgi:peptide chain release factor 1
MPQIDDDTEVSVNPAEIRVDVYRSSGPGGQGVNTTDSAVRITHLATGIVVTSQNQRSQIQNREQALKVLKSRLLEKQIDDQMAADSNMRKSQVRTADRSERIRTYNFPENRVSDHRTGFKSYNLDQVLQGNLEPVIQSCIAEENSEYLKKYDKK